MTEQVFATADKLSKVIKSMQTCLQCTICLHTISEPVKTLCGHRFCRTCIQTVLQNKNALCPLCNTAIQRRAISPDENMRIYINRLHQLIEAIQMDSGIDISSRLDKSGPAKENRSPVTSNNRKESTEASRSSVDLTLKKDKEPNTYRNTEKQKRTSNESKNKKRHSGNSDILRYLTKYSISGVEPLSTETTNDFKDIPEEDKNSKVHSWLNTLPETEAFDDPDKISPEQAAEGNLDDTLTVSVSQGCKDNKLDDYEAEKQPQHQSPLRRSLPNNRKDNEEERGPSRSSETRSRSSKTELLDDQAEPRPSTSGITRSSEECKERLTEVQRTSPCDMLPSAKRNWSSVVQFGKEMCAKKKKKLKSLNVSRSRLHEENVEEGTSKLREAKNERRKEKSSVPPGVSKDLSRRTSIERRKDPEVPTNMVRNTKESLYNVGERRKSTEDSMRRSSTPINITRDAADRSRLDESLPIAEEKSVKRLESSDEVHIIGESSFIVLEDEEQVHIRKLSSHQMNNIIGITTDDTEDHPEASDNKDQAENALPLKKRRNMSHASPPSMLPIPATPKKTTTDQSLGDVVDESTSKCHSVTSQSSNRGKLSLTRRNDSSGSNSNSRLLAATRDLNRQIDESLNNSVTNSIIEKDRQENRSIPTRLEEDKRDKGDRSVVMFRKLGKVFKRRKKPVKFLYLGSTRRKLLPNTRLGINYEKPCNFVDYYTQFDENIDALEQTFGSNLHITMNDSTQATQDKPKDLTVQKPPEVTTEQNPKDIVPTASAIQKPCSLDVVFMSLDEPDEKTHPRVEPSSSKVSQDTMSKSTVNLMSPSNDSQLKYLPFDSPTSFVITTSKSGRIEAVKISDYNKDNLFEVKGEHSRASVPKASGSFDHDSHRDLATKRKRSKNENEDASSTKKKPTDEEDNGFESDHSFSSKATFVRGSDKETFLNKDDKVPSSKSSTKCADAVSLDSDSDVLNHSLKKQKKGYRKRAPVISSGTDSPATVVNNSKNSTDSPPPKRKRTESPDSDCEIELEALVKDWCEDLNISGKKKSNLEQSRPKSPEGYKAPSGSISKTVETHSSQPRHLSRFDSKLAAEEWNKVIQLDEDSPDFAATIDRIQNIRKNASTSGNRDSKQADTREVTMTDNFNELNFDTNEFDDYLEAHQIKPTFNQDKPDATGSSSARPLNKNLTLAHRSSSSDKENKYKGEKVARGSDSHDDVTVIKDNARNDKVKALELTSEQSKRNSEIDKSSTRNAMTSDQEKRANGLQDDSAMKEASDEQDSLMNVTQHDLLLRQVEVDLFGRPLFSSNSFESKRQEQKTPQKKSTHKDTEHSADEDDIVENTPDAKTKNNQLINLTREGSAISSNSKTNDKYFPKTPSSVRSTLASTPCSKKSIHPLFQSTPKTERSSTKMQCNSAMKPATTNVNEAPLRRTQTTLGIISNSNMERLCFVCSGLVSSQVEQVKKLAQMMDATYLTQFEPRVTHVIVKVDQENNGASKTLKYLQGIAHRKWVVGYQWVIDSLKEKKLAKEECYEAVDCNTLEAGPRNSRLRKKDLFEGFAFLCIGPYVDVSVEQYRDLLRATGATVLDSLDALTAEKSKLKIIVIQADVHDYEIIVEWYRKARAVPMIHDWVVECISQWKLISFYPYLQELSREDVLALGYPDSLVEEEVEGDAESIALLE